MITICLLLSNFALGHGFFYTPMMPPSIIRPQGNNGYEDAQNSVGYAYDKPATAWSDVRSQQLILEPVPKSQYVQDMRQQQYHHQPSQQIQNHPSQDAAYDEPYAYLQPPQKNPLAFNDQNFEWNLQPAIKYNMPHIPHPFFQRDPQQQQMSVLVPLRLFGVQSFPPVLERLIQMVQNHYSVYNSPDTLTIPYSGSTEPTKPYVYEKPSKPFEPTDQMMGTGQEAASNENKPEDETNTEGPIDERYGNKTGTTESESTEKPEEMTTVMEDKVEMTEASTETTMKPEAEEKVEEEVVTTAMPMDEEKDKEETTVAQETSTTSPSQTMSSTETAETSTSDEGGATESTSTESTTDEAKLEPMN